MRLIQKLIAKPLSELFQNLKLTCQEADLKELFEQDHFHFVQKPHIIGEIKRLVGNPYFKLDRLCQIPLTQEFRLYGNLQKIKYTSLYLFKTLILDPNHLIYNEQKFKYLKNLTCLFNKTNCPETKRMELKKSRKK